MFLNLEYIFYLVYRLFSGGSGDIGAPFTPGEAFFDTLSVVKVVMWVLAFFASVGIVYLMYLTRGLRMSLDTSLTRATKDSAKPSEAKNKDWHRLVSMVETDNPAEWKIAILDADKMLEALTIQLGFDGDSVGERLKNADTSRMTTLESAWEAHKVRNRIAHEPNHVLTKREARKAMLMFETVFKEFALV